MKYIILLLFCVLSVQFTYVDSFSLPNPLEIVGGVAGGIGKAAQNVVIDAGKVAEGVAGKIDNAVESGLKAVVTETTNVVKTVAEGVDNAAKTLVTETSKIAGGLDNAAKTVITEAAIAAGSVAHDTKKVLKKVHKGVFDINKGFVGGIDEVIGTPVNTKEVTFYLITADNINDDNLTQIDYYKPDIAASRNGTIFFFVHGWSASMNSTWYRELSEILVRKYSDIRIVQVDWKDPAGDLYALAAFKTESIGELVGNLIYKLTSEYDVPLENFILIGHSLGAQICGWAGKKFKKLKGKKLPRIIALDPAGPLFILRPDQKRLNKKDAEVVMVIHTDADKLGFPAPCGTIDFFPNGGGNQPGCWTVDLENVSTYTDPVTCDHSRAWDYFVYAVNITGSFMGRKCESYKDFKDYEKCENIEDAMGNISTTLKGSFYLQTGSEPPYTEPLKPFVDKSQSENTTTQSITQERKNETDESSTQSPELQRKNIR